jgi:hypothetical protein
MKHLRIFGAIQGIHFEFTCLSSIGKSGKQLNRWEPPVSGSVRTAASRPRTQCLDCGRYFHPWFPPPRSTSPTASCAYKADAWPRATLPFRFLRTHATALALLYSLPSLLIITGRHHPCLSLSKLGKRPPLDTLILKHCLSAQADGQ